MARFDDQFERHAPLTLRFDAPSDTWPRRIAFEAQAVLGAAARAEINRIAHFLDLIVGMRAIKSTVPYRSSDRPTREVERELEQQRKLFARSMLGDVHLLGAGGGTREVLDHLRKLSDEFTEADLYAVLSLWKLIDYTDLRKPGFFDRKKHSTNFMWWPADTPLGGAGIGGAIKTRLLEETLAEAAYAAATAWRLKEAALLRDGLQTDVDEANRARDRALEQQELEARRQAQQREQEQQKRTEAGEVGAAHRWAPLQEHKAKAWELANSQKFRSRAAAARHAAARIPKDKNDNEYTPDTVDGWLKYAGWKRQK